MNNTVIGSLDIVLFDEFNRSINQDKRIVRIWKPLNYNKELKYPVIYFHDGQNVFDEHTSFSGEWEADETMDRIINNYSFDGAILVGIDNSIDRLNEYTYNHPFINSEYFTNKLGNDYMNFLVNVVKPYVDSNYSTLKDRKNTTIIGSSMGGLISLFGGLEHLEVFGNIIAFSTSTRFVDNSQIANYLKTVNQQLLNDTKYYYYIGSVDDGDVNWPKHYSDLLSALNVPKTNIKTLVAEGFTHNELAWRTHLEGALVWIFNLKSD